MQQPPLSNDEALRALQQGATLLALDVPEGTEFGVDLRTYSVGAKFRGMKMVPPGLHLVLCGNEIAKSGAFVRLAAGEVRVLQWDPKTEMLTAEVNNQLVRVDWPLGKAIRFHRDCVYALVRH